MDVLELQKRLARTGYNPGPLDGDIGPKTYTAIINWIAGKDLGAKSVLLGRGMAADFPKYGIVTKARLVHFLAQAGHETMSFRYLAELGNNKDLNRDGFDDYLQRYDFREDLGNNKVGMGPKYRGRGIFQLTGFFNYMRFGRRIGVDLVNLPEKAADPEISVTLACLFWADRKLNALADANDIRGISRKINGGTNGLDDRIDRANRLARLIP